MSRKYISRKTIKKTAINKSAVATILNSAGVLAKKGEFAKKDGTMDMEKFHASDLVKHMVERLKEMGVTKDWLWDNGFVAAGMVLPKF